MKSITRTALLAAAALGVAGIVSVPAAAQQAPAKPARDAKDFKLTKEVRNLVAEAQTLLAAGDTAGTIAKLDQALPLSKTADDKFIISQVMIQAGGKANDQKVQGRGVDLALESGALGPQEAAQFQFYKGNFAFFAGDYVKALAAFKAAQAGGYQDPKLQVLIADSSLKSNDSAGGLASLRQAVEAELAAGRKPDENWYKRGRSIAYQAKNDPETIWWSTAYLKSYPTQENWRTTLVLYRDASKLDPQTELDLYRLMRATKSLAGERDFFEYADAANNRGLPGEAKAVIDEGRASNAIGKPSPALNEIYGLASPKVAADRASLPASEKAAANAANGRTAANTGDALLGYGEYARAAAMYQLALQKGGQDANTINTRLGIALAMSGNAAGAKEAFAKVTGPRKGVADYWVLYVDQRAAGGTPA